MSLGDIIAWIIVGGIAGWIASMIAGTNARQGAVGNIIAGIIGAFVGGFVMHLFDSSGASATDAFSWRSFLVAILGAVIVLFVWKWISRSHSGSSTPTV
jgi:uncharacterized membrane protein YeaQ/YmgE (transglycosylase-associated protein family)